VTGLRIEQLWVPSRLDAEEAADFLASVEVSRQVRAADWGNDDLAYTPEEMLAYFADPYERYVVLLARAGGHIVGRVGIAMPLLDGTDLAFVTLDILPAAQHGGIGRELLEAAESFVLGENRRTVVVETHHPAASLPRPGDLRLEAADGAGSLPLTSREVVFARKADYVLNRVNQFSACSLPLDPVLAAALRQRAESRQEGRYRLHRWEGPCPQRWLEGMARLEQAAASGFPEHDDGEPWTGTHIRESEVLEIARGRRTLVTAVEDVPAGELVGMTSISVLRHRSDVVFQDDTVVRPAHRGRDLGLLIKLANMAQLQERVPDARRIYTWNISGNEYVQSVNAQLGFTLAGVTGEWEKKLDAHR
jgi:GNAT superfamily N-acetyltransferase